MLDVADLRAKLVSLKLTGELNRNHPESIRAAIREMIGGKSYWAMGARGLSGGHLTYEDIAKILAHNLGITMERFESDEPPYIDPDHTMSRLITGMHRLQEVARDHGDIMLASAHPGSLLGFYQLIGRHLEDSGARLVRLTEPVPAPEKRWLDDAGGVIVLSDEGNLMHTHSSQGIEDLIAKAKPDIIMADHAFAVAGMNAGIATVAIFDVDDAAIPVLAARDTHQFVAVPMNDNQTNSRTTQAAALLIETLTHAGSLRHPPLARSASST